MTNPFDDRSLDAPADVLGGPSNGREDWTSRTAQDRATEEDEADAVLEAVAAEIRGRPGCDSQLALDVGEALRRGASTHGGRVQVVVGADVAFVVHVADAAAPTRCGRLAPRARTTYGLTRTAGRWMVVHEHVSNSPTTSTSPAN